jgi:Starch-binding associating with outer membrane
MKKIFNKLLSTALVSGLLMVSSCGDVADFGDINVNPNATTVPVTSALLTNAISGMGGTAQGIRGGLFCQYYSETQYTDASLYSLPTSGFGVYAGVLYDLQNIINNNTDAATKDKVTANGSNANQIAVARILKAFYYMYMTDQVGDIPYSAALKGDAKPAYDTQQAVYTGLFAELKAAAAQFDGGADVKGDILFGGDVVRWKKFANSMRLILALRISKADATLGKAEALSAIAGGVIEDNANNATLAFPGGVFKNPWFTLYDGRKDYAISDVIVTAMTDLKDPRVKQFGNPNASGTVVGFPYGLTRDDAVAFANSHADYGFVLKASQRADNTPQALLTAAHVFLARAEAAQRGWTTENMTNMYNAGIKASWQQWGVYVDADYAAYIADAKVSLAADPLLKIGTQRWLAFFPDGTQGWSEWRRTGYPVLKATVKATNSSKQIPRRFVYPATEGNLNKDNYTTAVGRLSGGDTQDAKIWWDK